MNSTGPFSNNLIIFPRPYNAFYGLTNHSPDPQSETIAMSDSSTPPPDIEGLKDKLYGLPAKKRRNNDGLPRKGSLKRRIFDLYHALQGAKTKGHTYEDLAKILRDSDSSFSSLTAECLRKYYKDAAAYFEPPAVQPPTPKVIPPRPSPAVRSVTPDPNRIEQQLDSASEEGDSSLPSLSPLRRITNPSPTAKADESEFLNLD